MPVVQPNKAQPSVEELVASLKRSELPTVICEGTDDLIVYRRIEERLGHLGVSVMPAGGRKNVLQIFERRAEIPSSVRIAFIADRDTWVNTEVPAEYVAPVLCLTSGYSIENDVIADGKLEDLLAGPEAATYKSELKDFLDWYALALSRHLVNPGDPISDHPNDVLKPTKYSNLMTLRDGESYPAALRVDISARYEMLMRGKSLLQLIVRNTNNRRDKPKHKEKALLESVAARPGELLTRIHKEVEAVFSSP